MALRVVEVLQAVLDPAEEHVRGGELVFGLLREKPFQGKILQDLQRRPDAQLRVPPAADELQRL
ncbi:MAG: hypothetical protein K0R40_4403, partial [Burkholderiales bacterium]|nr:hypothetical protein [Burkholderiales bacterium]